MPINTGSSLSKLIVAILLLAACHSATKVPKGIIELNPMKALMWDIAQVEAYATQHISRDSTKNLKTETLRLYQQVFALHKTNKEQFTASVQFYQTHPETQKILMDSLMQYGTRQRDKATQEHFQKPAAAVK